MLNLKLMEAIAATTKRGEKETLLAQQPESAKEIFKQVCSPDITFGVTTDETVMTGRWSLHATACLNEDEFWRRFMYLLELLATRKLTGHGAINEMERAILDAPTIEHCRWACRIINRDLRAGIQLSTVNKVWKGLIPKFTVALANKLQDYKKGLNGLYFLEPKIDGLRCVIIDGKAYTRNGKPIKTADHVIAELPSAAGDFVLDGELLGVGAFEDTISQIKNVKKAQENEHKLVFNVFDAVRADEWAAKKSRCTNERKNDLVYIFRLDLHTDSALPPHIRVVPWTVCQNPDDALVQQKHDQYVERGYEGAMIKSNVGYEWKRSNAVLKKKDFLDIDLPIVGFVEGQGKYQGMMGTMVVCDRGNESEVGTGFSDAQRRSLWENREKLIGMTAELKYQNKTKDGALRIAVFKGLRGDKDVLDGDEDSED